MIQNESEKHAANDSLQKPDDGVHQYPMWSKSSPRNNMEKNGLEMDGSNREYSAFYRNSSEEMFLKSLMDSSIGAAAPNMENMGFRTLSQSFRGDSEELFNSWLQSAEHHGYGSASIAHRTRQASRRISTELAGLSNQPHGGTVQNTSNNERLLQTNTSISGDLFGDVNQRTNKNGADKGLLASNLYLAKAWLESSHPMTRSRSSELRRRYAAMQGVQVPSGEGSSQWPPFASSSMATVDAVSSVVSMLKGTIERKKMKSNQIIKETVEPSSFGFYGAQEVTGSMNSDKKPIIKQVPQASRNFQVASSNPVNDTEILQTIDGPLGLEIEDFSGPTNQFQMGNLYHEPSQSESSAAAPVLSNGIEICDGPTNSGQTVSVCESSRKQAGNGSPACSSKARDYGERACESNLNDDLKKGNHIVRMGSMTSGGSVDKGDPTKKRRVERSRKMAEAKGKSQIPPVPSDMQAILKRCENLEKEVRSLKLNLSFMNRKDSEQTKQIEELQKENEDLMDEKERLLQEIERIIAEPGRS
ncbi:uncharacterized protein LOC18443939 isoform X1 [Amborella trichopoda]|uniref:uncharacterized protein LOC18443939 isoform X1 n=2 Tax=Amborella trichopoda TaxID=13333 RepID=UPI0009BF6847|nr:uncharacterized protein LOC18443939 isoform X1 [Amborella trichopoda]|eukprot:XP_011627014.2 uncharacterized protein LOC18443939 isoform X1 [Amborella trichopoda]